MDESKFIEVIGSAPITRTVEKYRGTICIFVKTRKTQVGLDLSLKIRNQVIDALKASGLSDAEITDAGGSIGHSRWSSKKQMQHEFKVTSEHMNVFAKAMTAVEDVFSNAKPGLMSGISNDFSFTIDEPVYAKNENATENAHREAVADATRKAVILAESAIVSLGPVVRIEELARPYQTTTSYRINGPMDFDLNVGNALFELRDPSDFAAEDYTSVSPKQIIRLVQIRVRFGINSRHETNPAA